MPLQSRDSTLLTSPQSCYGWPFRGRGMLAASRRSPRLHLLWGSIPGSAGEHPARRQSIARWVLVRQTTRPEDGLPDRCKLPSLMKPNTSGRRSLACEGRHVTALVAPGLRPEDLRDKETKRPRNIAVRGRDVRGLKLTVWRVVPPLCFAKLRLHDGLLAREAAPLTLGRRHFPMDAVLPSESQ